MEHIKMLNTALLNDERQVLLGHIRALQEAGLKAAQDLELLRRDLAAAQVEVERLTAANKMHREAAMQIAKDAEAEVAALRVERDNYYCLLQRLAKLSPNNAKYLGIKIDAAIDAARKDGNG